MQSRHKTPQVFPKANGVESEPGSDLSSDVTPDLTDVTSDLTDVTSNITDVGSEPPSRGALMDLEQGTLGAVVRGC